MGVYDETNYLKKFGIFIKEIEEERMRLIKADEKIKSREWLNKKNSRPRSK